MLVDLPGYYSSESPEIDATEGGDRSVSIELKAKTEGQTGNLVINASESGALIEVDGKSREFAPAIIGLPVGPHAVRLTLKGYRPLAQPVVIRNNEETRLDLTLARNDEITAASRVAESVEDAPSSVSIVRSEELRAMHYPTIAEALRGQPGIYISDDRSYATVGFRGLSPLGNYGNRVLVLLDGQPTNDNWVGSSYVGYDARTDLADIERIEVVRGPGSVLYGTNAFSGVINLVTRGTEGQNSREVGISAGDYGVATARARINAQVGDLAVWTSVAAAKGYGRDFYFPEFVGSKTAPDGYARGVDGFQSATLNGRLTYGKLTALWFFTSREKGVPTGSFGTLPNDGRAQQTDTRGFVEVRFDAPISNELQLLSRAHINYYRFRGAYPRLPADGGVEGDKFDGSWAGLEERIQWTPRDDVRVSLGGEAQSHFQVHQEEGDDTGTHLNQENPFRVLAAYLLSDLTPSRFVRVSVGTRLDSYSTFGYSNNPRLAVVMHPYEGGAIKVLFGKAFRAPSIYELYYNDGGITQRESAGLRPESIYSGEIELSHHFLPAVTGSLGAYSNVTHDLIIARGTGDPGDLLHYENSGAPVMTLGGEASIRREFRQGWMLEASYSFQRSRYLESGSASDILSGKSSGSFRGVPNSPEHLASFRATIPMLSRAVLASTRLSFESGRLDRHDQVGDPIAQSRTDPAVIWDLVFSREEPTWGLRYSLGVYNAFDWHYSLPVSNEFQQNTTVQNGRTFLGSVDIAF